MSLWCRKYGGLYDGPNCGMCDCELRQIKVVTTGICRVCGCTELAPCCLDGGLPCAWLDADRTLCDNLECIAQVPIGELEQMTLLHLDV